MKSGGIHGSLLQNQLASCNNGTVMLGLLLDVGHFIEDMVILSNK